MRRVVLLLFLLPLACRHPLPGPPEPDALPHSDTLIYVMAGQSNMAGRGQVAGTDTPAIARLLELSADSHFVLKQEPNMLFQGWLAGLDCGRSFGEALLPRLQPREDIGLVQCSVSSTSITEWLGDSTHGVPIYSSMLARSRVAMRSGTLKAVLWMQGESDAMDQDAKYFYADELETFIRRYRNDAGAEVPFIIGLLPSWCRYPFARDIDSCIRQVAARVPGVYLVQTDDLAPKSDSIHLDASGQRELGRRMAGIAASLL